MNKREQQELLQALSTQVLVCFPHAEPEPSVEVRAWLEGGAQHPAARRPSPWRGFVRWFAGLGIVGQSLVGTSVALAGVTGAGAAGLLPAPAQQVVDDMTMVPDSRRTDSAPAISGDGEPALRVAPDAVPGIVLLPRATPSPARGDVSRERSAGRDGEDLDGGDAAGDRAEEDQDRAEEDQDRAEEDRARAEDKAEEAKDAAEDADDEAKDDAEDRAEDESDEAEDDDERDREGRDR